MRYPPFRRVSESIFGNALPKASAGCMKFHAGVSVKSTPPIPPSCNSATCGKEVKIDRVQLRTFLSVTELKIEPRAKSPPATSSSGRRNFIPPILGAPQNWGGGGNFRHPRIISFDKVIKSRGCKYVAPLGPNFVPKGDQIWFSPLPLVTTEKKYTTFSKRQNDALKRNRQSESFVVNAQNSQLPESLVTPRMPGRPTLLWSAPCNILICAFALPLNGDILEYYHSICKKSS